MIALLNIFIWALGIVLPGNSVSPCMCSCVVGSGETPPAEVVMQRAVERADALFLGRVMSGQVLELEPAPGVIGASREFTFLIEEQWKGEASERITIRTGAGGGDCGYEFELGQYYLVYAYRADHEKTSQYGDHLYTGICTITGDVREKEIQAYVDALRG